MSQFGRKGTVRSVLGDVNGDDLGITLTHEHLSMKFDVAYTAPPEYIKYPANPPDAFKLPNLGLLRQYPYGLPYNILINDKDTEDIILDELLRYKNLGGKTVVENTIHGIERNGKLMKKLSELSGVNIICGTGYYVAGSQSSGTLNMTTEQIQDKIIQELTTDIPEEGDVRCGVIGEIGSSWPVIDFEKRVIEATAAAQEITGAPATFHPGRYEEAPFEIIRLFQEAGGKAEDVIMCHLERTIFNDERLLEFAELKTFLEFDLFGTECSHYQILESIDMPSDAQRIQRLKMLKDAGYLDKILISHDIHTKHRLANFGGHGYGHILQNIAPKMKDRGFTEQDMDTILVQNPKRWLCGV